MESRLIFRTTLGFPGIHFEKYWTELCIPEASKQVPEEGQRIKWPKNLVSNITSKMRTLVGVYQCIIISYITLFICKWHIL